MGCGVKANFVDGEIASSSEVGLHPYYSAAVTQIRIICVSNSSISSAKQNKNISNSSILSANHCNSEVTWIRSRINDSCFEGILRLRVKLKSLDQTCILSKSIMQLTKTIFSSALSSSLRKKVLNGQRMNFCRQHCFVHVGCSYIFSTANTRLCTYTLASAFSYLIQF